MSGFTHGETIGEERMKLLVTGATGKVGQTLTRRVLSDPKLSRIQLRALCHNRLLEPSERLEIVRGSMPDQREVIGRAHV